ncbi:hypothetical protein PbJCM13498_22230 [Prolixibacter bellariivorans]|uniref:GH16 domain-containing protein n=1 Tax=Prolixibacter bellariivorans TaxID=314319 RepID=A0A5M4AZN8_9BACT|nr:glycoside hydrolase family 16 protein [Prolixibacter bellariivorans]GET33360.1 hypothetical protein PbJCM13498_22230 [Prolixibacter bellariivorans]
MKKIFSGILLLLVAASCHTATKKVESKADGVPQKKGDWNLVWDDEFNYNGLPDSIKWSFDTQGNESGWGNHEAEFYTDKRLANAQVADGMLTITARKEDFGGKKYTSARIRTIHKGDWLGGRIEVKARLPKGKGLWPAIWMLSTDWKYGGWPESGEIDIMENVGYDPDSIHGTVHTKAYNHVIGTQVGKTISVPDCHEKFHVYALEWDANEMRMFVDDQKYFTFKNEHTGFEAWPFDQPFHLILNVAVGGDWGGKQGIDDSVFPQTMDVDYVRVYQKNEAVN